MMEGHIANTTTSLIPEITIQFYLQACRIACPSSSYFKKYKKDKVLKVNKILVLFLSTAAYFKLLNTIARGTSEL